MSDKKVTQLTHQTPLTGAELVYVVGDPVGTPVPRYATTQEIADMKADPTIASQAEAEAGVENTKMMTALRTAQAIAALGGGINYQQEPPTSAWADQILGALGVSGTEVVVDVSSIYPTAKAILGYLYLNDNTPGTGTWQVQIRPANISGSLGRVEITNQLYTANAIGLLCIVRCNANSQFKLRAVRSGSLSIDYAFAPVAFLD